MSRIKEGLKMKTKDRKSERGSVVIELALVMPLLMLLFMGIAEFGRIFMIQQMLINAAREGARVGAINLDDTEALTDAENVARDYLTRSGVDLSVTEVQPVFSQVNGTQAVEVNIDYQYAADLVSWFPGINDTINLRSQVVMRREA